MNRRGDDPTRPGQPATDGGLRWTDLTGFQRDLLKAIDGLDSEDRLPTGKAIKGRVESMHGGEINHARVYQNLNDLSRRGCIDKAVVDGRTNAYRLSASAEALLEEGARQFDVSQGG